MSCMYYHFYVIIQNIARFWPNIISCKPGIVEIKTVITSSILVLLWLGLILLHFVLYTGISLRKSMLSHQRHGQILIQSRRRFVKQFSNLIYFLSSYLTLPVSVKVKPKFSPYEVVSFGNVFFNLVNAHILHCLFCHPNGWRYDTFIFKMESAFVGYICLFYLFILVLFVQLKSS